MVWGGVSVHRTGRLYIVTATMNSDQCIKMLDTRFFPQANQRFPGGDAILMHDGAPCHRSRRVQDYLDGTGIEVLPWLGNSPDMNPIEGL